MRSRNGFVSNSSSSSFIIAVRKTDKCQHCGRSDPDLLQLIEMTDDCETEVNAQGHKAVLQALLDQLKDHGIAPDADPGKIESWSAELLRAYRKVRDDDWSGWELADISIGYHTDALQQVMKQAEQDGTIQILNQEG